MPTPIQMAMLGWICWVPSSDCDSQLMRENLCHGQLLPRALLPIITRQCTYKRMERISHSLIFEEVGLVLDAASNVTASVTGILGPWTQALVPS